MRLMTLSQISAVKPAAWNALTASDNPFIKHEFLSAFEQAHCLGPDSGWVASHLVAMEDDQLAGATPLYIKYDSWGEFVFDFAWADAYQRSGKSYYPKLICAVPQTPATGPRLLVPPSPKAQAIRLALVEAARDLARASGASSLHYLFPPHEELDFLQSQGFLLRHGCQYHWHNQAYADFDHFLDSFSADKRKKVKRERRRVLEAGIEISIVEGAQLSAELWDIFYLFYSRTFLGKSGYVPLTAEFFRRVGRAMPENVVMMLARHHGEYIAAALCFRSMDTLYGRYWGAADDYHSLHFELCYYTGIEYCIRQGLRVFEPGAQGEHKISRGFLPTLTYSAHSLAEPAFHDAIRDLLARESAYLRYHMEELNRHSPYKSPLQFK